MRFFDRTTESRERYDEGVILLCTQMGYADEIRIDANSIKKKGKMSIVRIERRYASGRFFVRAR